MEKQVNDYILDLFKNIEPYTLSDKEEKKASRDKIGFILDKISRKKFRRKLTEGSKEKIRNKIKLAIEEEAPIHFTIPFGGYKHFWNPSHPEPDWAELFNFRFLTDYVLPIMAVHRPGIIMEYISEDLILTRMNNYSKEALDAYSKAFNELIEWYNSITPNNLQFKYLRISDQYDKEQIISEVEKMIPERIKEFDNLSEEEKDKELHRSTRSIMWDGEVNLTGLGEEEKQKRIIESRIIELAYYDIEAEEKFLGNYLWEDNHITICFSFGLSHDNAFEDLALASNNGSIVDFWIGRGVLVSRGDRLIPRTISNKQYKKFKSKISEINIKSPFSGLKNLKKIDNISD